MLDSVPAFPWSLSNAVHLLKPTTQVNRNSPGFNVCLLVSLDLAVEQRFDVEVRPHSIQRVWAQVYSEVVPAEELWSSVANQPCPRQCRQWLEKPQEEEEEVWGYQCIDRTFVCSTLALKKMTRSLSSPPSTCSSPSTSTPPSTPPTPSRERSLTVALPSVFKLREFDCYLIAQIVLSGAPWHMGCNVSRTNHLVLASLIRLSSDGNVAITFQPVFFCMNIFRGRDPTGH